MKVLHIMFKHPQFNDAICYFYSNYIQEHSHEVCIINMSNEDSDLMKYSVKISTFSVLTNDDRNKLCDKFLAYDVIILHAMHLDIRMVTKIMCNRFIRNKIVCILYGYDLYRNYNIKIIKGFIVKNMMRFFYRNIQALIAIFPTDVDEYYKRYKKCNKIFYAPYISGEVPHYVKMDFQKKIMAEKYSDGEPIIVQVGHSSYANVRHFEILDQIAKFKNENIKVLLPLSYGDVEYGDRVEKYAREILGDKVITLRDFMTLEDYIELLSTVDIGIWNTHRQIGLGNINPHVYMGKKIYLSSDCIMNQFFKENNVPIFDSSSIDKFDDFISDVDDSVYDDFRKEYFDTESKIKKWEAIYRLLELNNGQKK